MPQSKVSGGFTFSIFMSPQIAPFISPLTGERGLAKLGHAFWRCKDLGWAGKIMNYKEFSQDMRPTHIPAHVSMMREFHFSFTSELSHRNLPSSYTAYAGGRLTGA